MTHLDIPNWLAPAILVAIGGISSLVKMWAAISSHKQHADDQDKDIEDLKRRSDLHETRIGTVENALSRIEAGIEYLKRAFDGAIGGHKLP